MNPVESALSRFIAPSTARYITHWQFWFGIAILVGGTMGPVAYLGEQYAPESFALLIMGVWVGIFGISFIKNAGDAADKVANK